MDDLSERESNTDVLKAMNLAFQNERKEKIDSQIDAVIRLYLSTNVKRGEEPLSNAFSIFSNYLQLIIRRKLINPNFVMSSIIKWARPNHVALFLLGMVVREGANPNVYLTYPGKGNLHVLAWMSVARGQADPMYQYMATVLRLLGSNIYSPAVRFEGNSSDVDVRLLEQAFEDTGTDDAYYYRAGLNVVDYVAQNGYVFEKTVTSFLNSMDDEWLLDTLIATDDVARFNSVTSDEASKNEWKYIASILHNPISLTRFIIDLSTASSENIAAAMDVKKYPLLADTINGESIPLFACTASCDRDLFNLFIRKGSSVKYSSINTIITFYKIFHNNEIKLFENCFHMLNDAVKIGADIDLYQFNFFVSSADYSDIEKIRESYQTPKWKKLCSVKKKSFSSEARPELRQIAFNLNLDYSMDDKKICSKLEQISQVGIDQYFESAIRRQEERVSIETEGPTSFLPAHGGGSGMGADGADIVESAVGKTRSRCNAKSMVLKNPYAYNDARLAFYKDPKSGEVYCFTSDMFNSLISTKMNPHTNEKLPHKFLATIKAQLATFKEIGVYETNHNIKDSLKDIYSRSKIDNKKTDLQYNTVIEALSHYGVSRDRFESLRSETLKDTILEDITQVNLTNFSILPMVLKQRTTTRILYSLAKTDTPVSRESGEITDNLGKDLFISIARAISGDAPNLLGYLDYVEHPEYYNEEGDLIPEEMRGVDYDGIVGGNV
jgi:hypothetical protein